MKRRQKTAIIAGEPALMGSMAATPATGSPHRPDVPQHPLDGPIPTD